MNGYQSIFNSTSLLTNSSDIIFSDLTPDTILYVNSTLNPASVVCGTSLSFTGGTLNTVQGIRTTDSPTFAGLTVGSISGILKSIAGVVSAAVSGTDYEPPITAGTTAQYFRGDKSLSTFATDARAAISASGNLSYSAGLVTLNTTLTGLTSVTSTTFVGALTGNSSTATALSTSGAANQFWKNGNVWGQPTQADISGLTTASTPTFAGLTLSSALTYANGGTGQSSYAKGDLIIASAINTLTKLGIGSSNQVLAVDPINGIPAWSNLSSFGVSSIASADANIACSRSTGAVTLTFNTSPSITNLTMSGVISLGGSQPDTNIAIGRAITSTSSTAYNLLMACTLTTSVGSGPRASYGLYMANTFVSSTSNFGEVNFYNIFTYPTITATAATVDNAYSIYSAFAGGSGTITNAYNAYFAAPGIGTNRCSLWTADLQVGGTILSGSSKSGFAFIANRLEVGSGASPVNTAEVGVYIGRVFTGSTVTCRGIYSINNVICASSASLAKVYGFQLVDVLRTNTTNLSTSLIYGISSEPTMTPIATVAAEYGIYSNPVHLSGTVTSLYGGYFDVTNSGGTVTNSCGLYASNAQIGGSILSGSSKTGLLYVDGRISVGGSTNNTDNTLIVNRSFTTSAISAAVASFTGSITAFNSATGISLRAFELTNTLISSALNTAAAYVNLYSSPTINATASTVTTAYGVYSVIPGGSGTVISAYSGFFGLPSMGSTDKVALYTESIYCGASAGSPGIQTAGTITATGNATFNNMNLSGFTFRSSLACAAQTVSGSWKGMNSNVSSTFYYSRFGYIVMLTIPVWNYPNTSTTQTPYFDANPSGWAPTVNSIFRVCANNANAYVGCNILVNTNCTVYLYGPTYNNKPSITNGGQAFPAAIQISWGVY